MRLDGLHAETQLLCNLRRGAPLADQPEHLQFPIAEVFDGGAGDRLIASETAENALHHVRAEVDLAAQHLAQCIDDMPGDLMLVDVAVRTGVDRALREQGLIAHGTDQHLELRVMALEAPNQFQAIAIVQRQVDDDHVRHVFAYQLLRFAHAAGLGANTKIRLLRDQALQALAHQGMIVDDQDRALVVFHDYSPRLPDPLNHLSTGRSSAGPVVRLTLFTNSVQSKLPEDASPARGVADEHLFWFTFDGR